jgi:hypothetical protein
MNDRPQLQLNMLAGSQDEDVPAAASRTSCALPCRFIRTRAATRRGNSSLFGKSISVLLYQCGKNFLLRLRHRASFIYL